MEAELREENALILQTFKDETIYDHFKQLRANIEIKRYVDQSRYEGEVFNSMRHGRGIYYYPNGAVYLGHWNQDKMHGKGNYLFPNAERYDGEIVNGRKKG